MATTGSVDVKDRWSRPSAILVATDLSDLDRLMPFALEQATETGARLILLHVLASAATMRTDASGKPYYDPSGALEAAAQALEPWCLAARLKQVACDALVREGNAAQGIAASAHQFKADRILLTTRSRGRLGKLLLGSVAEEVLRSASVPVMTVGPEAEFPAPSEVGRVVLHATALREGARPSAALACRIAASQRARLVLLHVLPSLKEMQRKGLPASLASAAMLDMTTLADETGAHCVSCVAPLVAHGDPIIEILAAASEQHANLIVLGATERRAFEKLSRDRTIYRVLAHARCPVLTLYHSSAEPEAQAAEQLAVQGF